MPAIGSYSELTYAQIEGHDPVESSSANRISAFNFCNPFDHILPAADGTIGTSDRQHLWGLYVGIAVGKSKTRNLLTIGVGK